MCQALVACNNTVGEKGIWESAIYTEDTEFGNVSRAVLVEVKAEDRSVIFKINSDREKLGEALIEHNLISAEDGAYGLY